MHVIKRFRVITKVGPDQSLPVDNMKLHIWINLYRHWRFLVFLEYYSTSRSVVRSTDSKKCWFKRKLKEFEIYLGNTPITKLIYRTPAKCARYVTFFYETNDGVSHTKFQAQENISSGTFDDWIETHVPGTRAPETPGTLNEVIK